MHSYTQRVGNLACRQVFRSPCLRLALAPPHPLQEGSIPGAFSRRFHESPVRDGRSGKNLHGITGRFLVKVGSRTGTERGVQIHTAHWFGPCHPCTEEIIKELSFADTL